MYVGVGVHHMWMWVCVYNACGRACVVCVCVWEGWWCSHWNTQSVCVDVHSGTLLVSEAVCLTVCLHID